ncbi:hypothetical protein J7L68_01510 [bacterium]|nr:hypothetical protein [bacterium]
MKFKFIIIISLTALVISLFLMGCAERSLPDGDVYAVVLDSPDDSDTMNNSRAFFDWETYPNANGYRILVWCCDSLIWDRIEFNSSVKSSIPLIDGDYRWCVGARIGDGDFGHWSDTLSFTIDQIPFEIKGFVSTPGVAHDVVSLDNYLYVADGEAGMSIIDNNILSAPEFIGNYDWAQQYDARGIFADGTQNILAIADYRGIPPIYFFDITDRESPGAGPSGLWARLCGDVDGIWMRDTLFIIVADHDDGLYIYDLGTPEYATQRGPAYTPDGFCSGVSAKDTFAAVAAEDVGIVILNISDPDNKTPIGFCDTPGEATRCKFYDNYLYVADGLSGLVAIDISDPTNPNIVYRSDTQVGDAQDIAIQSFDSRVYLALAIGSDGVLFYNLDNPASPQLVGQIESMYAYGVGADSIAFYIADRDWGIVSVALE